MSRALRSDLWLIPLLCVVASVVLAVGTLAIDRYFEYALVPQSLVGSPAAAQTVLSTIAFSMVTLASLMLSLTLVAVQLAKGQFSRASCARCSATVAGRRDELERAVRLPRRFDKRVHRSVYSPSAGTVHSEATERQLELARAQGEAYGRALAHMTDEVAHDGGEQPAEPPTFMRHEEVNSRRFTEPVDVEFCGVKVERGQD